MRIMPFMKRKKGIQFAGVGLDTGGGGSLPIASENTLGGVKVGQGLSVTSDGTLSVDGGGGVVDYSTTETDMGIKWIDGKKVYRKVIVVNPVPSNGSMIATIPDVSQIIKMQSVHKQGSYTQWYNDVKDGIILSFVNETGRLNLNFTGTSPENGIIIIIVEYTKTTN